MLSALLLVLALQASMQNAQMNYIELPLKWQKCIDASGAYFE